MASLSGTRVLVTGGTSGLGRAMAGALVQAGARVVLTSRDQQRAEAAAAELGAGALGLRLDVRDATSVAAAVDSAYRLLEGLDMLVNNAGIGMRTVNPGESCAGPRSDEECLVRPTTGWPSGRRLTRVSGRAARSGRHPAPCRGRRRARP